MIKGLEADSEITIISVLGQELYRIKSNNSTNAKVDVSRFDKGIYILTVMGANSNKTETFKFIKN